MGTNRGLSRSLSSGQSELPLILRDSLKRTDKYYLQDGDIRVISRKGRVNIRLCKVPEKSFRYASDLWYTLVNMRWRWLLLVIALVNVVSYILVGLLFFLDSWASGDFEKTAGERTCLRGMKNVTSYFMLGMETITTVGYGYSYPTEFCYFVFFNLWFSTMLMIFIDGAFISVVYAKFLKHGYTCTFFSKKAVISLRNGKLCLTMKINDLLGKHWIENQVKMFLIKSEFDEEGESIPKVTSELNVQPFGMIFWPVEVVHEITSSSPLWDISANDLKTSNFEVVLVVVGSSLQTGQPTRSQTSYLAREIVWGHRFSPCMEYKPDKKGYVINRKDFDATFPVDTPVCSANAFQKLQAEIQLNRRGKSLLVSRRSGYETDSV